MSDETGLRSMTADIVAAYVGSRNHVQPSEVASLISSVHRALAALTDITPVVEVKAQPAVPLRKAVQPHAITCLFDGREFKSLKRHLANEHELTPAEYRAHWGLPKDSPMVAPNYAAQRSALAVATGLGQRTPSSGRDEPRPDADSTPAVAPPKQRGRPRAQA